MLTITCLLALGGVIAGALSLAGKVPAGVGVLLLGLAQLLLCWPVR